MRIRDLDYRQAAELVEQHLSLPSPAPGSRRLRPAARHLAVVPDPVPARPQLPPAPPQLATIDEPIELQHPYAYSLTQRVTRVETVVNGKRRKRFNVFHLGPDGEWMAGAGLDPWPVFQQDLALQQRGGWLIEAEGEKCVGLLLAAGVVAFTHPGHAHKIDQCRERYRAMAAAGVSGVVLLSDNDDEGERRARVSLKAAEKAGLPMLHVPAASVWEGLPQGGSIDDAPGTIEDQLDALERAVTAAWGAALAMHPAPAAEPPSTATAVVRRALADALADGASGADLEELVIDLAAQSELHPMEARRLLTALQQDAERAASTTAGIADEVTRIKARAAHRAVAAALTLDYLLPAPIAQALELRTRYLPADAPAVACLFLSSVASLQKIGSRITGNPASGFTVPLNLWTAVIAASGQKKSPLLRRVVLDPTAEIRQALVEGNRRDLQDWNQQCREAPRGQKPDPPQPLRLHVGDVTGEALAAQLVTLAERQRGLLVLRDELSALFTGLNQYKGGGGNDGQFLLELFDGGGHTSLRISGTREFSDSLVSIAGCMQPAVLAQLVNTSTSDADGRYARFLFAPLTQKPKRLPCPTPEEQAAIGRAGADLQRILGEIHREPARHLHLGPDAMELFANYEHRQALAAAAATIPAQGAVLGKAAGKVLRVAGLLHRIDAAAGAADGLVVGPDALLRAIDLIEHLNGWVLGLHADLAQGPGPTSLMRKLHKTAQLFDRTGRGPLQWRRFRDRLGKRQAAEWGREGFEQAAQALVELGVGQLDQSQKGGPGYIPTADLP